MRRGIQSLLICSVSVLFVWAAGEVRAADPFEKFALAPAAKSYLVLKDVNVRAGPKTNSKRIGRLRKKMRVKAVGKAKGTEWIAIQKDGENFGFVYVTALVPMIDGQLSNPLKGNLAARTVGSFRQPSCHYKIQFVGKVKVEGDPQITSDYQLVMQCKSNNKKLNFAATMFITELPYLDSRKAIYQINVDLLNIPLEDEDVFSTTALYHAVKNEITFAGVSHETVKAAGDIAKIKVANLSAALKGAVAMAHQSWGAEIWRELAKGKTQ